MNQNIPPISDQAIILEGAAHNGKSCRVIDNTGSWSLEELQTFLNTLIEQKQFGLNGLSSTGTNTIKLGEPQFTHIQHNDKLYRLVLFPYEARIEEF